MNDMLTIIVPVYKIKEEILRGCIESLLNQGREDYRVILVDDGSPDNCGTVCDEYAARSVNISVIHQENQGVSVARNSGIKVADTKWVSFVDADDWVERNYIDTLYQELSKGAADADIVMYEYNREFKSSGYVESLGIETGYLNNQMLALVRRATFYKLVIDGKSNPYTVIAIWNKIYKTEFLKSNNIWFPPEARKGQDRLFNADALNTTSKVYYIRKLLYYYRCLEESRTNRFDANIAKLTGVEIESLQKIIEKHGLQKEASEYLKCRICTRLYSCMRLYYFHDNNICSIKEKIDDVKKLVSSNPYKDALTSVNTGLLNTQEKIFIFCIKARLYRIVYLLVKVKSGNTSKKLSQI